MSDKSLIYNVADLPTSLTSIGAQTFYNCSKVYGELNLPNLKTLGNNCFTSTTITKFLNLGEITILPENGIASGEPILLANLPSTLTEIKIRGVGTSTKVLIVRAITPPSLASGGLPLVQFIGKIYVPDDSVESYKQASEWINYAEKIFPLSEYAEGEEDEVTE